MARRRLYDLITIIQDNDKYRIQFRYDSNLVFLIKQVPGKMWEPTKKYWTIPSDKLGFFLAQIKGTPYERQTEIFSDENIGQDEELPITAEIPDIDVSDYKFRVMKGGHPYKHQIDFMKYAIARERSGKMSGFLLLDEMGAGKSAESLNLAVYNKQYLGVKHVLIICCINTSKYNWMDDIRKHTQGEFEPYLLGTRLNKKGNPKSEFTSKDKLEDLTTLKKYGDSKEDLPFFNIINVEAIRMNSGRKYPIADRLIELINSGYFQMIFIDEIHKNMSPQSQQGKQIARIKKYTEDRCMWIPLTGTPIVKKPLDLYLPLRLVDGHQYTSFWKWSQNFCIYGGFGGHEVIGYKNINQLKFMLQYNSIRRLKKDILDLPPKIEYTEYVENTPYQKRLYKELQNELRSNREECVKSLNPMAMFLRLRQVNGSPELVDEKCAELLKSKKYKEYLKNNAKLCKLLETLENIHERGEKVVIFSNWVEPLRTIYKIISTKYKTCVYTGTMSEKERQHHKDVFIKNPHYTVMLGTIGALGTSHTLTVARNAIFYDCPWNMTDFSQASDRIHRVGTKQSVMIYKLITKDTVDERVDQIMFDKQGISGFIVDNIDIHSNPRLFDLLLSDTRTK